MSNRTLLLNAFSPNKEIELPQDFAGRQDELLRGVDALHGEGTTPIIYGDRGIGKTSLATQLALIALGNQELLDYFGKSDRGFDEDSHYVVVWANCSTNTANLTNVLDKIIVTSKCIKDATGVQRGGRQVRTTSTLDLHVVKWQLEEVRHMKEAEIEQLSPEDQLGLLLEEVHSVSRRRVLVIVDELDLVDNTEGLGTFIKTNSSSHLKFMLVGVSDTVSNLLHDHESLARQLCHIRLPKMHRDELKEIVHKAEVRLQDGGVNMSFTDSAKTALVRYAGGMPWFVHVLGKDALVKAHDSGRAIVDASDIDGSVRTIAGNEFSQEYSDQYQECVKDSMPREIVLRALAEWNALDVPTADVYRICRELGVGNPSQYKQHLTQAAFGRAIVSLTSRRAIRFRNPLFKQYVVIRPSLYLQIGEKVKAAYDKYRGK